MPHLLHIAHFRAARSVESSLAFREPHRKGSGHDDPLQLPRLFRWYPSPGAQALLAFVFVAPVIAGAAFARTESVRIVCGSVLLCLAGAHLFWGVMPLVGVISLSLSIALLVMSRGGGDPVPTSAA